MFEHLDDPRPLTVDDDLRVAVAQRGRRRQGRARLRAAAVSLSATLLLFAGATAGFARWQVSRIDRVSIGAIPQVDAQGNAVEPQSGTLDQPFTMLVIGNDHAPPFDQRGDGNQADTIMLVRVDKPGDAVRVLSIPRDTLVTYGDGTKDRINVALNRGVPELITMINRTFGITVDHYAEAHFDGFKRVIDATGGVPLIVERPLQDGSTGVDLRPGCQVLGGTEALALARSRHLRMQAPNGDWVDDVSSDIGRVARQQIIAIAAAKQMAHGSSAGSFGSLDALIGVDPSQITLDDQLGLHDLLDLSGWVGGLPSGSITTSVPAAHVSVTPANASVLVLDDGAADAAHQFLLGPPASATSGSTPAGSTPPGSTPSEGPRDTTARWSIPDVIRAPEGGRCP